MGLTLADGVYQTRKRLGEQLANYWKTEDIIYDLNYAAQDMCSEAQNLELPIQFLWPNAPGTTVPIQEAALQPWVDQILAVAVYSGQLFQLQAVDAADVQVANRVGNIPLLFYTKTATTLMSPQGVSGVPGSGDITLQPVAPVGPNTPEFTTVLGLWPIPSQNYDTTIWCTRFHPFMNNPNSICGIPARFSQGWIAYAVARGKEAESAFDEADRYDKIYYKAKEDMRQYFIMHKQLKTPPSYGGTAWPSLARGSSSIIFIDQAPTASGA